MVSEKSIYCKLHASNYLRKRTERPDNRISVLPVVLRD